jgi:ssDNA-binding Zn-finger/Zn-ribbon topoisomerase 1
MSKFEIRNHVDKLRRDGGKDSDYGDRSYHCPVCDAPNFKVNIKTGKWFSWGCDCASTEEGKREIRQVLSPAKLSTPKLKREYIYKHKDGTPLIKVVRFDSGTGKKDIHQKSLIDFKQPRELAKFVVPYKYTEALRALSDGHEYVFWVEGEKCCDALWNINLPAVSTLGGSKFKPERDANLFPAEKVVVVPDCDTTGVKYAKQVEHNYQGCKTLYPFPDHHKWNNPPESGGMDIADWLHTGATKEDIFNNLKTTSDKFIDEAKTLKDKLEDGLQKIDKLENVLLRTCALETLKKELGLLSGNIFDQLVNTLIRSNENNEPTDFDSIMASDEGLKPIVNDLLAVGLTLWVGDGFSGKSSIVYQILEAVSKGEEFAGQFPTTKAHTMIIQLDEPLANMKQKFRRMAFDPNRENFKVVWDFHPLMIPELEKWIVKHNTKVLAIDSLLRVCDGIQDICSAEMGLFIYRLNKIASKHNISIILVHHLNRDQKKQLNRVVTKNDIYGSGYIYNGTSDCYAFWKMKEEDSSEYRWILKNLKARSSIVDENETYEFSGNEEDYRFLYERMGSREISLKEVNNKTEMVRRFILSNPTEKYIPKQISSILGLNNARWAANILATLNSRGEIGKVEATDINTGGRKTYYYFAKGKLPI